MASPLILRIQAQLDKRGFDDAKRQLDRLQDSLTVFSQRFRELDEQSSGFVRGLAAAATVTFGALVAVGIRQERVTAQLANSLSDLGINTEFAAESMQLLTRRMAQNSLFSKGELLEGYSELVRATGSLTLASQDLAIAQEIAAVRNVSLVQSARALSQANIGLGQSLANLTGLTANEIEALREFGTLREELAERFPIGEATGRELDTLSGSLDRLRNRASATFENVGANIFGSLSPNLKIARDLTEVVGGALIDKGFKSLEESATNLFFRFGSFINPLTETQDNIGTIIAQTQQQNEESALQNDLQRSVNILLLRQRDVRNESFKTTREEVAAIEVAQQFLESNLRTIRRSLAEKERSNEATAEEIQALERRGQVLADQISALATERAALLETERTRAAIGRTSLREQIGIFTALSLSREDFQRRELDEEARKLQAVLELNRGTAEELRTTQLTLTNNRLRALQLEREVALQGIEDEVSARRQLFALLQPPTTLLDETASLNERSRALRDLVQLRKDNLALVESERLAALTAIELDRRQRNLREDDINIIRQREIVEAEARARRLEIEREFAAQAEDIGPVSGSPDFRERAERRIETLLREQARQRETQADELRRQIRNTRELERLERDVARLRELGREEGDPTLDRIIARTEQLREALGESLIPASEDAINNFVDEIERKLEIPPINVNLNVDQITLVETMRSVLNEELERRGFDVSRRTVAPSGAEELSF